MIRSLNVSHMYIWMIIVGYEMAEEETDREYRGICQRQKKQITVLLFGDAGTGKSTSSVKAILNEYYDQGLRMIEVYKHQFQDFNDVIAQIKNRNYKFIIYMDDLSFEEFEIEYKYLKAVIEGGLGEEAGQCADLCDLQPQTSDQRDIQVTRKT